jgi:hypothetical protein
MTRCSLPLARSTSTSAEVSAGRDESPGASPGFLDSRRPCSLRAVPDAWPHVIERRLRTEEALPIAVTRLAHGDGAVDAATPRRGMLGKGRASEGVPTLAGLAGRAGPGGGIHAHVQRPGLIPTRNEARRLIRSGGWKDMGIPMVPWRRVAAFMRVGHARRRQESARFRACCINCKKSSPPRGGDDLSGRSRPSKPFADPCREATRRSFSAATARYRGR